MRILVRCSILKRVPSLYCGRSTARNDQNVSLRNYMTIVARKQQIFRHTFTAPTVACVYLSDDKKQFLQKTEALKDALEQKREQIKDTEHRIRQRGEEIVRDIKHQKEITGQKLREKKEHIIKDILEKKAKVRERLEVVVEKENPFTIPNLLCVTRIVMSPYLGYVILQDNYNLALGLMVFAGVTDLLDGWIARNYKGQSSMMGSFLDPMADKILVATLFITLTWQNLIPLELTLLIVGRDVILVAAAFIIRYMSLPEPKTFSRYMDVTYATAQLAPTFISKVNTVVQLILVGATLASPVFGYVDHPVMHALWGLTAATTVGSAVSYVVSKDTYKFLKKKS